MGALADGSAYPSSCATARPGPMTHTQGFTNSGDMEEPSPSDSQSTGQLADDRRTCLRAPQHDLAPITHTPESAYPSSHAPARPGPHNAHTRIHNSGDMEEPSPSDSQSTGQPLDTHSTYTGPTAWYGVCVRLAAFQAMVYRTS
ncbi:unnamed protein product [Schistocephalus solidus]|uniref:Uncharacterized protein n=1 Tax=Schistocephalus solidus TaxID=70667 RepID=A0A183S7Z2_SCHSO|nr:unnamed protein product [Schistocephalus solidus]